MIATGDSIPKIISRRGQEQGKRGQESVKKRYDPNAWHLLPSDLTNP
jgi:hypothetical protein